MASGLLNLAAIGSMVREATTGTKVHWIPLGGFGGFYAGEAVLTFGAFLTVGLFYRARTRIAPAAWSYLGYVDSSPLSRARPSCSLLGSFLNGGSGAEPPSLPAAA